MKNIPLLRTSALGAAVAAALLLVATPLFGQTAPPVGSPAVVVEDRSLRERGDERNLTLSSPLEVKDATGATLLSLPVGTAIGRERTETRFAAEGVAVRQRTDLRNVTLQDSTTVLNRSTGENIVLPAGSVIRVKLDQRMDANGNIVRDRVDLRAVTPDGTRIQIRDRTPETDVGEVENEQGDRHRQRGRDAARPEDNSRGGAARGERADRSGSGDRVERVERPEHGGRGDRPERPERSGGGGRGPG